jgi:hypothetical protein
LLLPAVSLGLWHDVGEGKPVDSRLTAIDQAAKEADVHA